MVTKNLECDTLLGHCDNRLLVHVRIVNAHATEYRERLHKVLIIFGKNLRKRRNG